MPPKENELDIKRQELKSYQKQLDNLINKINPNYQFINNDYIFFSHLLSWVQSNIQNLQQNDLKDVIFLLGPTGAGKSTLVNYIKFWDANFIVTDNKGTINVKANSIAQIGNGRSGSTTLFPNIYTWQEGTFIDFAGDGDTTGQIAELINSITKQEAKYRTNTQYRTEYYDDTESARLRNFLKQVITLGLGDEARDHVRKSRTVPYTTSSPIHKQFKRQDKQQNIEMQKKRGLSQNIEKQKKYFPLQNNT